MDIIFILIYCTRISVALLTKVLAVFMLYVSLQTGGQTDVRRARLTLSVSKKALQTVGQTDVHMDRLTEQ